MPTVLDSLPEASRSRLVGHLREIGRAPSEARLHGEASYVDGYRPGRFPESAHEGDVLAGLDFIMFSSPAGWHSIELGSGVSAGYNRGAQLFRAVSRANEWFCFETAAALGFACDDLASRALSAGYYTNPHTGMGRDSAHLDEVLKNSPQSASVMAAESCSFVNWPPSDVSSKTGALVATNRALFASADKGRRGWQTDWDMIVSIAERRGRLGGVVLEIQLDDEDAPRLERTKGKWTDLFVAVHALRTEPV